MEYLPPDAVNPTAMAQEVILCCQCGTPIEPNSANMCVGCLRSQVDITEGIPKQANLYFCRGCERYQQPPSGWVACTLESRELLTLCLKKLKGLARVHLVDAGFVWTEPHSKRIKVKLTVQKEVLSSVILQQVFVVEYVVHYNMCDECHRRQAQDFWRAVVQVRQKTSHKKTFLYLEQLMLKHRAHVNALKIREAPDGIDFYYSQKQDARKLVDFLNTVVPCRCKTAQELISHDTHSNTFQYKHTYSVEIVPISKNDVVCLPLKLARSLGNISQVLICHRVTTSLHLTDPNSLQLADVSANVFWRHPFSALCDFRRLREFFVLQVEPIDSRSSALGSTSSLSEKCVLVDVWVVPAGEVGSAGRELHCRSHLGHLLQAGDTVLGFDFTSSNVNDTNLDEMKSENIPDVVLVRKSYGDKRKRHRQRNWRLQRMEREMEMEVSKEEEEEEDRLAFFEELEEDKILRQSVNIYVDPGYAPAPVGANEAGSEGALLEAPRIGLEEMLQELSLTEGMQGDVPKLN